MIGFIVFFVLAGLFEAVMDTLQFRFYKSIFVGLDHRFWNPEVSWQNKWKDGCPKFGPKFKGSTTYLVFLTDAWHLAKWFRNRFVDIALFCVLYHYTDKLWLSLIVIFVVSMVQKVIFEVMYKLFSYDKRNQNA